MNSRVSSLVAVLAAPALAFQPPTSPVRPSLSLRNTLRDMAAYPDGPGSQAPPQFDAFDPRGAFSRSPRGGMEAERMHTQDGFDPFSAYGGQFGMSQSDGRRGHMGAPGAVMGGDPNGVHDDNTLGGFAYSSRVQRAPQGHMEYGGRPPPFMSQFYEHPGGMEGGMEGMESSFESGFDPRFASPGPMMGGGMEFEQQGGGYYPEGQQGGGYYPEGQQGGGYYPEGPGGFGGFDGDVDLSRMGP